MKLPVVARSLALVSALAMVPIATASMAQVDSRVAPEFAKLFATYQRVKASYVDQVDDEKLIRGAIDGMLASLDPHSAYLDGSDLQRLETMIDGNYSGLGLSVVMEDGAVKVISPFRGSPAEKAGIKAEVLNVSPPDIVPALARGDIDAGVMFPDFYPSAKKALGSDYRAINASSTAM